MTLSRAGPAMASRTVDEAQFVEAGQGGGGGVVEDEQAVVVGRGDLAEGQADEARPDGSEGLGRCL